MTILPTALLRREVRHLFFMTMEASWIATVLGLLDTVVGGPDRPPTVWCLWLYPATYVYARLEQRSAAKPLTRLVRRVVLAGTAGSLTLGWITSPVLPHISAPTGDNWVLVLAALGTIGVGPVVLAAAGCLFTMARGWLLGPRRIDGNGFFAAFQTGAVILFAVAFLRHLSGLPTGGTITGATLFLAFGLYGLWLNRWLDSDFAARRTGSTGWPILAAAIVGLVLGAGILFGDGIDHTVVVWLLTPVLWLADMVGRFLAFLMSLVPHWEPSGDLAPPVPRLAPPPASHHPYRFGEITHAIGAVMFTVATSSLIAMLILRNLADLLRWLSRRGPHAPGVVHERSDFGILDDLRAILAALRAAVAKLAAFLSGLLGRRRTPQPAPVRAVRETYVRLLHWAAKRGWPRPLGQTPHEYLDVLRGTVPHLEADLAILTDAYVAVRYGAAVPSPDQLAAVRNGWRRIRRARKQSR